jgi:hypothetical protein
MLQGLLYTGVLFIVVYLFPAIQIFQSFFLGWNEPIYAIEVLIYIFTLLQGFFNVLIYTIPAFQKMHKEQLEKMKEKNGESFASSTSVGRSVRNWFSSIGYKLRQKIK